MTPTARAARTLPAAVVLAPILFFAIGPVLLLVARSVVSAHVTVMEDLSSAAGLLAVRNTLIVSAGAALLALLLATPLCLLLYRTDLPFRRSLAVVFTLPGAIPAFIAGMGWIALASPKSGYLNRLLGEGTLNIYSLGGMIFVLGIAELPVVLLSGEAALSRIDATLEEAARMSGAGPLRALLEATLPLAWPSLVAGAGLVALSSASAFGVPYLLGVSASPPAPLLTTRIYGWVLQGGSANFARAVGLSSLLLVFATGVLVASSWLGRRGRVRLLAGKGVAKRPLPLGRARTPLLVATAGLAFVTVLLPLLALFVGSVQRTFGAELRWQDLTMTHWGAVLSNPRTLNAAGTSVALSLGAAGLVCALGLGVAIVRSRGGRGAQLVETLAAWPYAVPGTVLALALIVAFSRDLRFILLDRVAFVLAMGDSVWLLIVAYTARHLAIGSRNVTEALAQLDPSLAEAARISGAGPARAFRDALLPLLRPALGLQSYADPAAASVLAASFVLLVLAALAFLPLVRSRSVRP